MPPQQQWLKEEAKFTYTSLSKVFQKQTRTIEEHAEKQAEALKSLEYTGGESLSIKKFMSERMLNTEIMNELKNILEQEQKFGRRKVFYKGLLLINLQNLKWCEV